MDDKPHFKALDSIRGVAALSVVLYHMSWTGFFEPLSFVRNSYLMVDLFFVLSGFVVFYAYGTKIHTVADAGRFIWLRFWRLYPMHFTFLMVFLVIECLKLVVQMRVGIIANHAAFVSNSPLAFIANVFLVQDLHLFDHITFNYPSWSISSEFYTYMLFALTVSVLKNRGAPLVLAAAISSASFGYLIFLGPRFMGDVAGFGMLRCLIGFFLGVLTFAAYQALSAKGQRHQSAIGWLALASLFGFIAFIAEKQTGAGALDLAIYPASAVVILLVALAKNAWPVRFLSTRPMMWLGTISYSIYMVHASVEWCVSQTLRFALHVRSIRLPLHTTPVLNPHTAVGWVATTAYMIGVLALANFTYRWIEKPTRDFSRRPTVAWRARW